MHQHIFLVQTASHKQILVIARSSAVSISSPSRAALAWCQKAANLCLSLCIRHLFSTRKERWSEIKWIHSVFLFFFLKHDKLFAQMARLSLKSVWKMESRPKTQTGKLPPLATRNLGIVSSSSSAVNLQWVASEMFISKQMHGMFSDCTIKVGITDSRECSVFIVSHFTKTGNASSADALMP